jgi:CheY-like chemotaxis protein
VDTDTDGYLLLVEDDPDTCTVYRMILEAEDYRVEQAHGGLEALVKLRTSPGRPRLVLLDLTMPGIDGFEFLRMKAGNAHVASVPVLVVSAVAPPADAWTTGDVRATLTKPVSIPVLLREVAAWAGRA